MKDNDNVIKAIGPAIKDLNRVGVPENHKAFQIFGQMCDSLDAFKKRRIYER